MKTEKRIGNLIGLIALLLLCSACVSRTYTTPSELTGRETDVITDEKLIWFWQSEFYE